jgi:hypothetical protein
MNRMDESSNGALPSPSRATRDNAASNSAVAFAATMRQSLTRTA